MSMMYSFCIFCAFCYAVIAGLVTISCEYLNKMPNNIIDKIIYHLTIKDNYWQDLNLCP